MLNKPIEQSAEKKDESSNQNHGLPDPFQSLAGGTNTDFTRGRSMSAINPLATDNLGVENGSASPQLFQPDQEDHAAMSNAAQTTVDQTPYTFTNIFGLFSNYSTKQEDAAKTTLNNNIDHLKSPKIDNGPIIGSNIDNFDDEPVQNPS